MKKNVLVLGSGGREHALVWKIASSENCGKLFTAPGNPGTEQIAENVNLNLNDSNGIAEFLVNENIDLLVVGPEDPLVNGLRDFLEADARLKNLSMVGPGKSGARLEGSKDFSKEFMNRHQIPTAASKTFTKDTIQEGQEFLKKQTPPYVLKADGLAAGKGVVISESLEEASAVLNEMLLDSKFGEASSSVLIEEFLKGIEVSVFVLTDGKDYLILPEAKDYKRIGEGDQGLNTGGMGAVSPVDFADESFMRKVEERIIQPTVSGLNREGIDYKGFLFIGLMNVDGNPLVIEYNVRMGDPETQAVLARIDSDFLEALYLCGKGKLSEVDSFQISDKYATTVVMVSGGYPESYEKGHEISGTEDFDKGIVFHAGTSKKDGKLVNTGGRVLAVTAFGDELKDSINNSYQKISAISWKDCYYRKDIGKDLMEYKKK